MFRLGRKGIQTVLWTSLAAVCLLAAWTSFASAVEVRGIRHSTTGSRTRVVLDLDRAAAYKHWTLGNPARVLITLESSSVGPAAKPRSVGDGYVERIRVNTLRDGRVQIVLDLQRTAEYQSFTLPDPPRIVVDVLHAGAGSPPPVKPEPTPPATDPASETGSPGGSPAESRPEVAAPRTAGGGDASPRVVTPAVRPRQGPWRVAIDAGHGGKDAGSSHHGAREKDIALALARAVVEELNRKPGIEAFLTRKGDYFIPLRKRWTMAQDSDADLFVSVHCDGVNRRDAKGTSVYFLSLGGASDEASRELAERENAVDAKMGIDASAGDLGDILFDMSQTDVIAKSEMLAEICLDKLFGLGTVYSRGVKQAGFAVLKSPAMPSVLVEAAFISNPEENRMLRDRKWQKNFGRHLANGIEAYCRSVDPAE